MRLKQAKKLLHALVLAINKATCRQDKISQIKDQYGIITDIWNKQPCALIWWKIFYIIKSVKKVKEGLSHKCFISYYKGCINESYKKYCAFASIE